MEILPKEVNVGGQVTITGLVIPNKPGGIYKLEAAIINGDGNREVIGDGNLKIISEFDFTGDEFGNAIKAVFPKINADCKWLLSGHYKFVEPDKVTFVVKANPFGNIFDGYPHKCIKEAQWIFGTLSSNPETTWAPVALIKVIVEDEAGIGIAGHRAVIGYFPGVGIRVIHRTGGLLKIENNWRLILVWG